MYLLGEVNDRAGLAVELAALVRCPPDEANRWLDYRKMRNDLQAVQMYGDAREVSLTIKLRHGEDVRFYDIPYTGNLHTYLRRGTEHRKAPWHNTKCFLWPPPYRTLDELDWHDDAYTYCRTTVAELIVTDRFCRIRAIAFPQTLRGDTWNMAEDVYTVRFYWDAVEYLAGVRT